MLAAKLFALNEILTFTSGLLAAASWLWMKWKVPEYRLAHLRSPGPLLGIVEAYQASARPVAEKAWVCAVFRLAVTVFLFCAIVSFAAGFVAAVRGPFATRSM
jgi:hypothetical protein